MVMLAAILREFGKPLTLEEMEVPHGVMKVGATGLCHGDLHIIMGEWSWDLGIKPPLILGHEIALEGEDGTSLLLYNARGCGKCKVCSKGFPQFCERVRVLGVHEHGGFAEYVQIPSGYPLVPVKGEAFEVAPLADAGVTAYNSVKGIGEGDSVAVLGTGAVSMFAVQMLSIKGAEVTVVGRNESKLSKMLELGASEVVKAKGEYSTALGEAYPRRKFDYVIDYVGSDSSLRDAPWLLSRMGELRLVGEFGGELNVSGQLLVLRGIRVRGVLYGTLRDLIWVKRLFERGSLRPISVPYTLSEINEAISDLMEGRVVGRAVIVP